jgi:hypothetical protein
LLGVRADEFVVTQDFLATDKTVSASAHETGVFSVVAAGVHLPLFGSIIEAGSGLGSFLGAITDPLVNFVLALGIIGGILTIMMGFAYAINSVFRYQKVG